MTDKEKGGGASPAGKEVLVVNEISSTEFNAQDQASLPALVDRAAKALANARGAAEVLEVRDLASLTYDIAKKTARLAKAKQAHDDLIAAAYRAQADALEIEALSKRRLADEYDAAQERGEVQRPGGDRKSINVPVENNDLPTVRDIGLSRKDVHDARLVRDAELADPGVVRRVLNEALAAGAEPTKAKVHKAVERAAPKLSRREKWEADGRAGVESMKREKRNRKRREQRQGQCEEKSDLELRRQNARQLGHKLVEKLPRRLAHQLHDHLWCEDGDHQAIKFHLIYGLQLSLGITEIQNMDPDIRDEMLGFGRKYGVAS